MSKIWTENKIELITTYLRNGLLSKQIAKKMNVSVDSLDGVIRRYDLSCHKVPKASTSKFVENIDFDVLDNDNFEDKIKQAKLDWKIKKSQKKSVNKNYKTALFWPDTHIPHHNNPACKSMLKLMDDMSFDRFCIIGDFMDFGCISHWNQNKHKTLELQRLKNDYIQGNALLDEIDQRLPAKAEKFYCNGNHEVWMKDLLEQMPQLEGMIDHESNLKLTERGYKVSEYNELVKMGRLYVTHGIYAGGNPIKKHVDELKTNVLFGHTHTLGMQLFSSPARDIAFVGYNVGCLCDLSPDYMRNRPNGWVHGGAVGYFYPNGHFDIHLIRIINGKFVFNNKIYDGNK